MPDCYPEGNTPTLGSSTQRSWVKMAGLGASGGVAANNVLELGDGVSYLELGDGSSLLDLG